MNKTQHPFFLVQRMNLQAINKEENDARVSGHVIGKEIFLKEFALLHLITKCFHIFVSKC